MPTFRFEALTPSGEEVVDVIQADDLASARRLLSERHLFVTKLIPAREAAPDVDGEHEEPTSPQHALADFGWLIEPTASGVQLRRSGLWYGSMAGCSAMLLLLLAPFVYVAWRIGKGLWPQSPGDWVARPVFLIVPLLFGGVIGLMVATFVVHILRFALLREVWEANRQSFVIWRRLLGFSWSREFRAGELVLEPHYGPEESTPKWRLTLHSDGRKHRLLPPSVPFGNMSTQDSLTECREIAALLAKSTGWNVSTTDIAVEGTLQSPSNCGDEELIAALRSHRFVIDEEPRSRLTLSPPMLGARIGGGVLLVFGIGWLWILSGAVSSFLHDAGVQQQLWFHVPFWLLMMPLLTLGAGLCLLGTSILVSRERWIVDRNSVLVRRRAIRRREDEFVDAVWQLAQVRRTTSKGGSSFTWELQIQSTTGTPLKVLYYARDDDVPRLLGQLLSQRTGWPLHQEG